MGDDDALRIGRRAGGEDDLRRIVGAVSFLASRLRADRWLAPSRRGASSFVAGQQLRSQVGQRPHRALRICQRRGVDDVAGQDGAGADDLGDPEEKRRRGAIVDRDEDDALEEAPPERDDPLGPVLAPDRDRLSLDDAGGAQTRGKRARRVAASRIGQRPRAIAVVVDEKFAVEGCEIVEEVDERAPRHAR